jgi:hypothetical protein
MVSGFVVEIYLKELFLGLSGLIFMIPGILHFVIISDLVYPGEE